MLVKSPCSLAETDVDVIVSIVQEYHDFLASVERGIGYMFGDVGSKVFATRGTGQSISEECEKMLPFACIGIAETQRSSVRECVESVPCTGTPLIDRETGHV